MCYVKFSSFYVSVSPLSPEAEQALQSLELKMQAPPQFTQGLEDQTVARGSSALLSCHLTGAQFKRLHILLCFAAWPWLGLDFFTIQTWHSCLILAGYPDPEVVWLRGEEPVMESPTVQIQYEEDGHCTLLLTKAGPEDANVYTCRATNDHGETFCSARLTVKE